MRAFGCTRLIPEDAPPGDYRGLIVGCKATFSTPKGVYEVIVPSRYGTYEPDTPCMVTIGIDGTPEVIELKETT